jgi:hypothetical protein
MWNAFIAASDDGKVEPPELATYAVGSALAALNRGLARNKANGLHSKGTLRFAPTVTGVSPTTAPVEVLIADCVDDSQWLLYREDGALADDIPGGRRKTTAKVERTAAGWMVTTFATQGVGTC